MSPLLTRLCCFEILNVKNNAFKRVICKDSTTQQNQSTLLLYYSNYSFLPFCNLILQSLSFAIKSISLIWTSLTCRHVGLESGFKIFAANDRTSVVGLKKVWHFKNGHKWPKNNYFSAFFKLSQNPWFGLFVEQCTFNTLRDKALKNFISYLRYDSKKIRVNLIRKFLSSFFSVFKDLMSSKLSDGVLFQLR